MSRASVWILAACACGATAPAPVAIAPAPSDGIAMTATAFGPITAKTRANLVALRELLVGYEVKPVNLSEVRDAALEYQVFRDGRKMFAVIPDEEGGILNVHVTTSKVTIDGHPWRVGELFATASALTMCECWAAKPVCFKQGEHVAVAFDRPCSGLRDPRGRRALEGQAITRTVWSPKPFGEGMGGTDYGGYDSIDINIDP